MKAFIVLGSDKSSFRKWISEEFPQLEHFCIDEEMEVYPEFENRIEEVHVAAMQVLERIMKSYPVGTSLGDYYLEDYLTVQAQKKSGTPRQYARAIREFVTSLEWE